MSAESGLHLLWTPQAALYSLLGVAFLVAGSLMGATLLVVFAAVILLWLAIDALWAATGHPHVRLRVEPGRVPEDARARVELEADHLTPHHQIHVPLGRGLGLDGNDSNVWTPGRAAANLARGQTVKHVFSVVAKVRGPQEIGPVHVRRWSPSRLWISDVVVTAVEHLEVIPRMADVRKIGLLSPTLKPMQGRFLYNQPGQGMEFFALREYRTGDTMRDVNWKASARGEELIVNQRQRETQSEIVILLDARTASGVGRAGESPLDRSCRVALGLYGSAMNARDIVRFAAYGDGIVTLPASGGAVSVHSFEELLARLPSEGEMTLGMVWEDVKHKAKAHGPIFVLTSGEADDTLADTTSNMIARGHPVTIISPHPTGGQFEDKRSQWRRDARASHLQNASDRGAIVVDWQVGAEPAAERPPLLPGMV